MHVVFDPHPAVPREVHARLDGDDRVGRQGIGVGLREARRFVHLEPEPVTERMAERLAEPPRRERIAARGFGEVDRKSTRLNSSHVATSYAVFCLQKQIDRGDAYERTP